MKYDVKFSCGHTATVSLFGPNKDRERKISWYETHGECPECYKARKQAEREAIDAQAAQESKEKQWPELSGTPKQVAWANAIRKEKIDELMTLEPTEKGMRYIAWIVQTFTAAKYWIDNRDESLRYEWKWGQDVFNAYDATTKNEK